MRVQVSMWRPQRLCLLLAEGRIAGDAHGASRLGPRPAGAGRGAVPNQHAFDQLGAPALELHDLIALGDFEGLEGGSHEGGGVQKLPVRKHLLAATLSAFSQRRPNG